MSDFFTNDSMYFDCFDIDFDHDLNLDSLIEYTSNNTESTEIVYHEQTHSDSRDNAALFGHRDEIFHDSSTKSRSNLTTSSSDRESISIGMGLAFSFPKEFFSAFNEGNINKIFKLANAYSDENIESEMNSPIQQIRRTDRDFLPKFYEALLLTHPDGVVYLRNVKSSNCD